MNYQWCKFPAQFSGSVQEGLIPGQAVLHVKIHDKWYEVVDCETSEEAIQQMKTGLKLKTESGQIIVHRLLRD